MNEGAIRVVLLAREGAARDRLAEALQADGIELVAAFDPASADEAGIVATSPQAIVVALEPAIEGDVERLDGVLSNPALNVLFEEAELVARREGWEAARWQRHLSAKLHRHDDVLPPGTEQDVEWMPSPGPLPGHAEVADLEIAINAFADEAQQHADQVAHDRTFDGVGSAAGNDASPFDPVAFEADGGVVDIDPEDLAGIELEGLSLEIEAESATDPDFAARSEPVVADGEASAQADEAEAFEFDSGGLSLVDDEASAPASPSPAPAPARSVDALDERISGLSLADPDSYGFGKLRGAVLVEAGLGGPDAVRQLLSAIPEGFPHPILVRMQLDSSRNRRLSKQMERATRLVVEVASKGSVVVPGQVYLVPLGIGLTADKARLQFVEQEDAAESLPDALPVADSAVLLLSGASQKLAEALAAPSWSQAMVAGQSPEESYDSNAAAVLAGRGGVVAHAAALAALLVERWPPPDHPPPVIADEELQP